LKKHARPPINRRSRRHEEHTNHEAWAIPYGDLITLLLAFFVVMYALSSVNEGKYRVLSDSLYTAFRGTPRTLEPVQVGEHPAGPGTGSRAGVMQQPGGPAANAAAAPNEKSGTAASALTPPPGSAAAPADAGVTDASLAHVADQVENAMADLVKKDLVSVHRTDRWVEVEIKTDLLFPSGSALLSPTAATVLEQLAQVLAPLPNAVRVEGHTDNVPIRNAAFYSNWELSAARAGSVVRVLSGHGVAPLRLAVVGFGEQRPTQPNDTAQGRNANRRVVVVILAVDPAHANDPFGMLRAPIAPVAIPPAGNGPAAKPESSAQPAAPDTFAAPAPPPTTRHLPAAPAARST
jgi:chemotaxis protein MotB